MMQQTDPVMQENTPCKIVELETGNSTATGAVQRKNAQLLVLKARIRDSGQRIIGGRVRILVVYRDFSYREPWRPRRVKRNLKSSALVFHQA